MATLMAELLAALDAAGTLRLPQDAPRRQQQQQQQQQQQERQQACEHSVWGRLAAPCTGCKPESLARPQSRAQVFARARAHAFETLLARSRHLSSYARVTEHKLAEGSALSSAHDDSDNDLRFQVLARALELRQQGRDVDATTLTAAASALTMTRSSIGSHSSGGDSRLAVLRILLELAGTGAVNTSAIAGESVTLRLLLGKHAETPSGSDDADGGKPHPRAVLPGREEAHVAHTGRGIATEDAVLDLFGVRGVIASASDAEAAGSSCDVPGSWNTAEASWVSSESCALPQFHIPNHNEPSWAGFFDSSDDSRNGNEAAFVRRLFVALEDGNEESDPGSRQSLAASLRNSDALDSGLRSSLFGDLAPMNAGFDNLDDGLSGTVPRAPVTPERVGSENHAPERGGSLADGAQPLTVKPPTADGMHTAWTAAALFQGGSEQGTPINHLQTVVVSLRERQRLLLLPRRQRPPGACTPSVTADPASHKDLSDGASPWLQHLHAAALGTASELFPFDATRCDFVAVADCTNLVSDCAPAGPVPVAVRAVAPAFATMATHFRRLQACAAALSSTLPCAGDAVDDALRASAPPGGSPLRRGLAPALLDSSAATVAITAAVNAAASSSARTHATRNLPSTSVDVEIDAAVATALTDFLQQHTAAVLALHQHVRAAAPHGQTTDRCTPLRMLQILQPWALRLRELARLFGAACVAGSTTPSAPGSDPCNVWNAAAALPARGVPLLQRIYAAAAAGHDLAADVAMEAAMLPSLEGGIHADSSQAQQQHPLPAPPSRSMLLLNLLRRSVHPFLRHISEMVGLAAAQHPAARHSDGSDTGPVRRYTLPRLAAYAPRPAGLVSVPAFLDVVVERPRATQTSVSALRHAQGSVQMHQWSQERLGTALARARSTLAMLHEYCPRLADVLLDALPGRLVFPRSDSEMHAHSRTRCRDAADARRAVFGWCADVMAEAGVPVTAAVLSAFAKDRVSGAGVIGKASEPPQAADDVDGEDDPRMAAASIRAAGEETLWALWIVQQQLLGGRTRAAHDSDTRNGLSAADADTDASNVPSAGPATRAMSVVVLSSTAVARRSQFASSTASTGTSAGPSALLSAASRRLAATIGAADAVGSGAASRPDAVSIGRPTAISATANSLLSRGRRTAGTTSRTQASSLSGRHQVDEHARVRASLVLSPIREASSEHTRRGSVASRRTSHSNSPAPASGSSQPQLRGHRRRRASASGAATSVASGSLPIARRASLSPSVLAGQRHKSDGQTQPLHRLHSEQRQQRERAPRSFHGSEVTASSAAAGAAASELYISARQRKALAAAEARGVRAAQKRAEEEATAAAAAAKRAELRRLEEQAAAAADAKRAAAAALKAEDREYAEFLRTGRSPRLYNRGSPSTPSAAGAATLSAVGNATPNAAASNADALYVAARSRLLEEYGARIAALSAVRTDDSEAAAPASSGDAVAIALEALQSLGPAGMRHAAAVAAAIGRPLAPQGKAGLDDAPRSAASAASATEQSQQLPAPDLAVLLPELTTLLPEAVVTHIRVTQPPGGHATAQQLLYGGTESGATASVTPATPHTHVRVTQPSGGLSVAGEYLRGDTDGATSGSSPQPRRHVVVTQPSGGWSVAGKLLFGDTANTNDAVGGGGSSGSPVTTHVKVTQPSGGTSTAQELLYGGGVVADARTHVKVSQPSGGLSTVQELLYGKDGDGIAAEVEAGAGSTGAGSNFRERNSAAATAGSPGGQRTSVRVAQPSGGHSTIEDLLYGGGGGGGAGGAIPASEARGSSTAEARTHVTVTQPSGGHSTIQHTLYGGDAANEQDPPRLHTRVTQSPGGTSTLTTAHVATTMAASASPRARTSQTQVRVSQPAGGQSVVQSLLYPPDGSEETSGTQAASTAAASLVAVSEASRQQQLRGSPEGAPGRRGDRKRIVQPAGGTSTAQLLLYGGHTHKETGTPLAVPSADSPDRQIGDDESIAQGAAPRQVSNAQTTLGLWNEDGDAEAHLTHGPLRASFFGNASPQLAAASHDERGSHGASADDATMEDATVSLAALVHHGIVLPLHRQIALMDAAGACMLLIHHELLQHFRALRSWLLLGEGHVMSCFLDRMFSALVPLPRGHTASAPAARAATSGVESRPSAAATLAAMTAESALTLTEGSWARAWAEPGTGTPDYALAVTIANNVLANVQAEMGLSAAFEEYVEELRRLARLRTHTESSAPAASGQRVGVDPARERAQLLDDQRVARILAAAPATVVNLHRFQYSASPPVLSPAGGRSAAFSLWSARAFDFLAPQYDLDAAPMDAAATARRARLDAAFRVAAGGRGASDSSAAAAGGHGRRQATPPSALHLVITPRALEQYQHVHRFLMRVRRVAFELHRLWTTLMGLKAVLVKRRAAGAGSIGLDGGLPAPVFLLRHEAQHFITSLDGYLTSQVLEGCFDELLRDCSRQGSSISGLRAAHEAYTRRLAARCLVAELETAAAGVSPRGPPTAAAMAAKLLDTIFNVILDFCHLIQAHASTLAADAATSAAAPDAGKPSAAATASGAAEPPGGLPPAFPASVLSRAAICRREFRKHVRFLFVGLTGMSAQGAGFAHIDDLLARLSVTDYYSRPS